MRWRLVIKMNNTQKKDAVLAILLDPSQSIMSDRAIAQKVGVDHKTVAKYRIRAEDMRLGIDGRTYNVVEIGKIHTRRPQTQRHIAKSLHLETWLEMQICSRLFAGNRHFQRQVPTDCGIADIVTSESVIEVKLHLRRDNTFKAIGQVIAYRNAIDSSKQAIIVAKSMNVESKTIASFVPGVRVIVWNGIADIDMELLK